jgi:hypothetical protein
VRHLDDVLELARLLLHLGGQEERGQRDRVAVEVLGPILLNQFRP